MDYFVSVLEAVGYKLDSCLVTLSGRACGIPGMGVGADCGQGCGSGDVK